MTAPGVIDAAGDRQLSGGYAEFDGFLWLVARRDFRYWFAFTDDSERTLTFPPGKLYLLLGTKGEVRWDTTIAPKGASAALHVPASEVAKVSDGWPWDLCFEHQGGATEIVAEGFVKVQDGCGGVAKPLLPVVTRPANVVGVAPVLPPKPKSWVFHLEDKEYVHLGPGVWLEDPALPVNPVKGCVFFNVSLGVTGNNVILKAFIHDGTDWVDNPGQSFPNNVGPGDRPSTPTIQKYSNNPGDLGAAHSETQYFNPSSVIAVACADGIHMCYCDEQQYPPVEYVVPYPAGVSLADMPPLKVF